LSGERRNHVSFLPLMEMVSVFSPFSTMLAIGLSYITFIMLRYIPLFLVSSELLWKDVEFSQGSFLFVSEVVMWFLSCFCLYDILYLDLHILNYPCIPGMKPIWSCCMIFLMCYEFSLWLFYWEFFHLKRFPYNSLFVVSLSNLGMNFFLFFIFLLLICAYNAWVISPPCPHPLPYYLLHPLPLPPHPLHTQQKLFCPCL
jgi:hypothetical protein